jgi:hypothetical protein
MPDLDLIKQVEQVSGICAGGSPGARPRLPRLGRPAISLGEVPR